MSPLLFFFIIVEWRLAQSTDEYRYLRLDFESKLYLTDVLIIGNSRARMGIPPAPLSPHAFNLAEFGESLVLNDRLYTKYADRLPELKWLIVQIADFGFQFKTNHSTQAWRAFQYAREFGIWEDIAWSGWLTGPAFSRFLFYGRGKAFSLFLHPDQERPAALYPNGHYVDPREKPGSPDLSPALADERVRQITNQMNVSFIDDNERALRHLVKAARARQINVALVELPVTAPYVQRFPAPVAQAAKRIAARVAVETKIPYLDYSEHPAFLPEDFFDLDHLNSRGGKKLADLLRGRLLEVGHEKVLEHSPLSGFK